MGLALGLILPFIASLIYYKIGFSHYSILSYYQSFLTARMLNKLIAICVVSNLVSFIPFYYFKMDHAAKGVVLGTMLYAVVSIILMFT